METSRSRIAPMASQATAFSDATSTSSPFASTASLLRHQPRSTSARAWMSSSVAESELASVFVLFVLSGGIVGFLLLRQCPSRSHLDHEQLSLTVGSQI